MKRFIAFILVVTSHHIGANDVCQISSIELLQKALIGHSESIAALSDVDFENKRKIYFKSASHIVDMSIEERIVDYEKLFVERTIIDFSGNATTVLVKLSQEDMDHRLELLKEHICKFDQLPKVGLTLDSSHLNDGENIP
ncbi:MULTISPECIES: hypothetical protein [unclassified Pseudoalteromonas]|uniref:hypothetical protein n=1 Tax=unclassified Pseudoalteromonas TaxID=194690 RepID=UPI002097986E|nr:hypothetical protein [Pseudoalteromonas sp. XMcav2-N]MCO7190942.1 hypothetical protein [Pseudoalteromonas sp. XMcav2-N]